SVGPDADEHLAGVVAAKEPCERRRDVLDSFEHRFPVGELPLRDPRPDLADEVAEALAVVRHDEALDAQPFRDDEAEVARAWLGPRVVVARDRTARDDPAEWTQRAQRRLELSATDVVEVHV